MRHFIRHYAEMVVAMLVGMAVLELPLRMLGTGWHELSIDAPALGFLGMATSMTVPMVGWMLHRGHGWRANAEMSAAMFIPTFAVIALTTADLVTDTGALMTLEHTAMFVAMAAIMLARPAEYIHRHAVAA
jgi:flagellar biosynthetic protein FliP